MLLCHFQLKKSGKEPKVGADVILKNVSNRTKVESWHLLGVCEHSKREVLQWSHSILLFPSSPKVCERSTSPRWDEAFHFLVRNPREETLTVKVFNTICISSFSSFSCEADHIIELVKVL